MAGLTMQSHHEPGTLRAGWRLLWQTQRIVWWVYAVNLILGLFSAAGLTLRLSRLLDHSLAAGRLYHGFDLPTFVELASHPEMQFAARSASSLGYAVVFFIFMLFATGGILESYARNRMLVPGEFFQGCGAFFWRLVRLLLWLLGVLIVLGALAVGGNRALAALLTNASEKTEVLGRFAALLVCGLVLMLVRLWFDMAQVGAVVEDERRVTPVLVRAFALSFRNFGSLFPLYLIPSMISWAGTAVVFVVWVKFVPPEDIAGSFVLGQFVAWLWIANRQWQRASEVIWYQRWRPLPDFLVLQSSVRSDDESGGLALEAREVAPPQP